MRGRSAFATGICQPYGVQVTSLLKSARLAGAVLAALIAISLTACTQEASPSAGELSGPVTVFAAASLTESFKQIGKDFQAAHPGVKVTFNFAGSSALATQITQGAPADLFAAASPATMKIVTDGGDADGAPVVFVRNQLVIVVAKGNPKAVAGLADLARPGLKVALCAEQVPCGAAAAKALDAAGIRLTPVTLEQDVKAALQKVKLGEVDAALVYRTDVRAAATDVTGVEFPESAKAVNDYPIAVLAHAPNKAGARALLAWIQSEPGLAVLTKAGFQAP
jgi:molybdate transport system substrate-binding protein